MIKKSLLLSTNELRKIRRFRAACLSFHCRIVAVRSAKALDLLNLQRSTILVVDATRCFLLTQRHIELEYRRNLVGLQRDVVLSNEAVSPLPRLLHLMIDADSGRFPVIRS
jgi:hypothetical protein